MHSNPSLQSPTSWATSMETWRRYLFICNTHKTCVRVVFSMVEFFFLKNSCLNECIFLNISRIFVGCPSLKYYNLVAMLGCTFPLHRSPSCIYKGLLAKTHPRSGESERGFEGKKIEREREVDGWLELNGVFFFKVELNGFQMRLKKKNLHIGKLGEGGRRLVCLFFF